MTRDWIQSPKNIYKKIYSYAVAFDKKDIGDNLNEFYALVNTDRSHPISWVSIENEKHRKYTHN